MSKRYYVYTNTPKGGFMSGFWGSKKGKVLIASLTAIALIGVGVGGYFIFRKKLKYDYAKGAVAAQIVENAQYTPDMDKFAAANFSSQKTSRQKPEEVTFGSSSVSETTCFGSREIRVSAHTNQFPL